MIMNSSYRDCSTCKKKLTEKKVEPTPALFSIHPNSSNIVLEFPDSETENIGGKNQHFDLGKLPDGEHTVNAYTMLGSGTKILLKSFKVKKIDGKVDPSFMDLNATLVKVNFKDHDKPVDSAEFNGKFTSIAGEKSYAVTGVTNAKGNVVYPLPQGNLTGTAKKDTKAYNVTVVVPKSKPAASLEEAKTIKPYVNSISQNSSVAALVRGSSNLVILGDISCSMNGHGSPSGIEQLRKTYLDHLSEYVVKKKKK